MSNYTILDTRGLLLRDYHGSDYKSIETPEGKIPSWQDGLAAFIDRTVWPLLKTTPPRQILACWDGGNQYRLGIYHDYKKARRERDTNPVLNKELNTLTEKARRLLAYCGVKSVHVPGEEADDLIALFCSKLEAGKILVYTRDEDLLQLVDSRTSVIHGDVYYSLDGLGSPTYKDLPLPLIRLKKSIVGDTSDSYPGVKGAGPKFFEELCQAYDTDGIRQLEAIVASGDKSPLAGTGSKFLDKLHDQFGEWRLSYRLASLHPEACYGRHRNEPKRPVWQARVPSTAKVSEMLGSLGLAHRLHEISQWFPQEQLVTAEQAPHLTDLMPSILASEIVSYDFESTDTLQHAPFREAGGTSYVDVLAQELAGISVNWGDNLQHTIYVPFDHKDTANFSRDWASWLLQSLDTRFDRAVVQNANFELSVARTNLGLTLRAPYDTAIMASYVDENQESGLKDNSLTWFNYKQATYKDVTGGRPMNELTGAEVLSYGCDDSLLTSHLFDLKRIIMQLEGSWGFYCSHEIDPAINDVSTFIDGTDIDLALMQTLQKDAHDRIEKAAREIHEALAEYVDNADVEAVTQSAQTLLATWWESEQHKYTDMERAAAARDALWQKAWYGCFYTPPTETVSVTFIPSVTQLNKLIASINPALPLLDRTSAPGIDAWGERMAVFLSAWEDHLRGIMKTGVADPVEVDAFEAAGLFYKRLLDAKRNLSAGARDGKAYEDLERFCKEWLVKTKAGKVESSGDSLNWKSQPQMTTFLYGKLRLPIRRRSKVVRGSSRDKLGIKGPPATGLKATAAALVYDVLEKDDWRMPVLMNYREICLLRQEDSLYYKKYPLWIHPRDGKLHPQIKNCGTVTRRPSGGSPNVFQVPKSGSLRKCYVGGDYGDGQRIYVSADFASEELVITACESKDPVMLDAFSSEPRKDLHSLTATSFAHTILERDGISRGAFSYDEFISILHGEDCELKTKLKEIRNKYAKPCIAEGSLVLTDRGLVPIELVALSDKVWDGVEWVTHEGVIFKGFKEVIKYDGVTATPDHVVVAEDGRHVPIRDLSKEQARPRIAMGEVAGRPVRFNRPNPSGVLGSTQPRKVLCESEGSLFSVWKGVRKACGQPAFREEQELQVPSYEASGRSGAPIEHSLQRCVSTLLKPLFFLLQELWGKRNQDAVFSRGLHSLCHEGVTAFDLQRCADRSDKQRWKLRGWEPALGHADGKLKKQENQQTRGIQREADPNFSRVARSEIPSSGLPVPKLLDPETLKGGGDNGESINSTARRCSRVYDIVNAGPRHRFTVSGRIVLNCNFLIVYSGGPTTLAENLLITEEMAKELMDNTFRLYSRLKPWQDETVQKALQQGYIETAYGSRKHVTKQLFSEDKKDRSREGRQVVNYTVQGCAADILKVVRQEIYRRDMLNRYRMKAVKPVYDEISASIPIDLAVDYALELIDVMSVTPPGYPVSMKVDLSMGTSWGSVKELEHVDRESLTQFVETLK